MMIFLQNLKKPWSGRKQAFQPSMFCWGTPCFCCFFLVSQIFLNFPIPQFSKFKILFEGIITMTFPLSVLMKKKTLKIIMKKFLLIIFFHLLLFQHNILHKCCLQFNKITKFGDLFVFHKILQFNYDATG